MIYGFQKHLSANYPSQIIIDVTQYCNLACIHCPHSEFVKSKAFTGACLDVNLNKKLVNEIAEDKTGTCQYLRYCASGETLLHPGIDNIISYAGKHSNLKINITTNGILLIEKKANTLLDAGVNVFDISLDAFRNETYQKIRGKDLLKKVKQNILNLIKLIKKGNYNTKIVLSFIEQPLNSNEKKDFKNYWEEAGADFVVIRRLHSAGGAKTGIKKTMEETYKGINRKPCLYPWERLVLTPIGTVGFCPADWKHESQICSFKENSIMEIWQGNFMNNLRKAHLNNEFSKFAFCGQCPDWIHTRWPGEGRAYADMMIELTLDKLMNNK